MLTRAERIAALKEAEARVAARAMRAHSFIPTMQTTFDLPAEWRGAPDWRDRIAANRDRRRPALSGIQED